MSENNKIKFFTDVYKNNLWGGRDSKSGTGSEGNFAEEKIILIQDIIKEYNIQSIIDIGCGDLNWMKIILEKTKINYTGIDLVESLLNDNKKKAPEHCFEILDFNKIYKADLLIIFDVFGHQLHNEVIEMINYINKLDVKYVLVTNRINNETLYYNINKSRHEGINIEKYNEWNKPLIKKYKALYPDDFFCLYK
jgi:glutaredoxin-related protein